MLHSSKKDTWEAHRIELRRAQEHVFNAQRIVERQRDRVAKFKVNGNCAPIHEVTLRGFETTLNSLENHVALLRRELGE